jgi:formate-dependent nitrite reductase cytochrome c552 subunit
MKQMGEKMKTIGWFRLIITILLTVGLAACGTDNAKVEEIVTGPKTYIGSEQCKVCHLEHYDSWKMTLHSRTLQDVTENRDAVITDLNPDIIRADLKKREKELKVPVDAIYIPKAEDIRFTQGVQWKQRYVVAKNGTLYIAPIEYNAWDHQWVPYREDTWDKRPWFEKCGGCHATGVDLEKGTFSETSVGCVACHGPASIHVALPKTAIFDKRMTIVNPSKLPAGIRTQICGSCHGNGEAIKTKGVDWPVGFSPGRALGAFQRTDLQSIENEKLFYADQSIDRHHREYNDWQQSVHAQKGVSCTSCHYVHQLGLPPTQFQTVGAGSGQCLSCHTGNRNKYSHSIHSFSNCIGCHMPRITMSAESGAALRHTFKLMSPERSLKAGGNDKLPNSCSSCHHHKNTPLETLTGFLEAAKKNDMPLPFSVHRGTEHLPK